ncbi:MAG: exodeoxyribonuclease VII large subunit [Candidatus Nanogingivalaceae bacterium]|jgi:exodeoxyribonuclease VII, large subunit|nr:MAG: exodeoxyribonuclease VII large subunit [Candidatus Nanogingivalaceae bacterium]QWB91761.1 MAG: exodeoxyribonuclease VII large subunit [Candidatus Nanogingivalaceae bacterium]
MDFDEFEELLNSEIKKPQPHEVIYSVSDFIATSNDIFEKSFPSVLIEGEISSFKVNQNKFVFFDLKDEESVLGCFMTVWQLRFPLEDGMKVIAQVKPKLTNWGKFSLTVEKITPKGEGSLKKSLEILKEKLTREGLFDENRKRRIPQDLQKVAVISSTQAAGYADFIKIINERWGGLKIIVAHTQVQGMAASDQIIRAIDFLNSQSELPDVIAIIRGGGSADDLAVFNDEKLVRAVANSRVPIITGIGHEIDQSLCDLAADFAASTPSNVAQILTPNKFDEMRFLRSKILRTNDLLLSKIAELKKVNREKNQEIRNRILQNILDQKREIQAKKRILESYNPQNILAKGYALISGEIATGKEITIKTIDKTITAEVKNVNQN